jgi:hypothetical protein
MAGSHEVRPIMTRYEARTCERCFAYSHPYCDRCLGCGAPLVSLLPESLAEAGADAAIGELPRTMETLLAHLNDPTSAATVHFLAETGQSIEELWPLFGPKSPRTVRLSLARRMVETEHDVPDLVDRLRSMKLRYLGGLPYLQQQDVVWDARNGEFLLGRPKSGEVVASIAAHSLLFISGRGVEEQIFNGHLTGLGFAYSSGGVTSFSWIRPTVNTGQLSVAFVDYDVIRGLALGNRTGLLAPRPNMETYAMLAVVLGLWASKYAELRDAEIGPVAYAQELGLGPVDAVR